MKTVVSLLLCIVTASGMLHAQIRGQEPARPNVSDALKSQSASSSILGIIDPDRFSMSHSLSMGYYSFAGEGLGITAYTNSMRYKISDPLSVRADVSFLFSPFGSSKLFAKDINGINLDRAQIDYVPSKDFRISLQYRQYPFGYSPYSGYESGLYPWSDRLFHGD